MDSLSNSVASPSVGTVQKEQGPTTTLTDIFGDAESAIGTTTTNTTDYFNLTNYYRKQEEEICNLPGSRKVTSAEYIACLIAFFTILENGVILFAICKGPRSLRKPPYWFIANLALADALTGVGVLLAVFLPIGDNPMSRIALKGFAVVTFIVSINSLLFVSIDRYVRIVRHAEYKKLLSRKVILVMIIVCWIASVTVFLVAPLAGWSCGRYDCCAYDGLCTCLRSKFGADICGSQCSQSFTPFKKSYLLSGVIYFLAAVFAMCACYTVIFRLVRKKTFTDCKSQMNKRREIRLAKTLVITLGIFVICWLPVVGLFIVDLVIVDRRPILLKAFDYALVPSVVNSFLNPIIYSIRMPRMRATIQRLILPCLYIGSGKRGTSWVSSTSMEKRSIRHISIRRKSDKKQLQLSVSSSSGVKDHIAPKQGQLCDRSVAEISRNESHS